MHPHDAVRAINKRAVVMNSSESITGAGTPQSCPTCGSLDVQAVVYGMPGPGLIEAVERGDVALGGCVVEPDQPTHVCRRCEHAFQALDAEE